MILFKYIFTKFTTFGLFLTAMLLLLLHSLLDSLDFWILIGILTVNGHQGVILFLRLHFSVIISLNIFCTTCTIILDIWYTQFGTFSIGDNHFRRVIILFFLAVLFLYRYVLTLPLRMIFGLFISSAFLHMLLWSVHLSSRLALRNLLSWSVHIFGGLMRWIWSHSLIFLLIWVMLFRILVYRGGSTKFNTLLWSIGAPTRMRLSLWLFHEISK